VSTAALVLATHLFMAMSLPATCQTSNASHDGATVFSAYGSGDILALCVVRDLLLMDVS